MMRRLHLAVEEIHEEHVTMRDLDRVTPPLPNNAIGLPIYGAGRINWHGFARLSISRPPVSTPVRMATARFCAVKLFARTPEN